MKIAYYVSTVVNAYRRAIDFYKQCQKENKPYVCPKELVLELENSSHRRYTTGFYFGAENKEYLESSQPVQKSEFMAVVKEPTKDGEVLIEMRNKFAVGDTLEVISPSAVFGKKIKIEHIKTLDGDFVEVADKVQQLLFVNCDFELHPNDILRK